MIAGWQPLHMLVYCRAGDSSSLEADDSSSLELVASMPLYVKYHSQGEFIFDQSWAEYARSALGVRYYPKASICVDVSAAIHLCMSTAVTAAADGLHTAAQRNSLHSRHWSAPGCQAIVGSSGPCDQLSCHPLPAATV